MQLRGVPDLIMDPQQLNAYAYARNNPLTFVDPTGEAPEDFSWNPLTWDWEDASHAASVALETLPVTGDVSDVFTFITGETPFSQESVSAGDYIAIGIAAIIPGLTGGEAKAIKNVGENLINKGAKTNNLGKAPEYGGGKLSENEFLNSAENFLGKKYDEVSPGRYNSADGTSQVRYGEHEVNSNNHHGHFENLDSSGRVTETTTVDIR